MQQSLVPAFIICPFFNHKEVGVAKEQALTLRNRKNTVVDIINWETLSL
jgi:hypothetical protein